jgi:hypothetical protein
MQKIAQWPSAIAQSAFIHLRSQTESIPNRQRNRTLATLPIPFLRP